MGLFELLQNIKERPGIYLCTFSVFTLSAFLSGYRARSITEGDEFDGPFIMAKFQEYMAKKINKNGTNIGWQNIVRMYSNSDHQSFYVFFDFFEDFIKNEAAHQM